MWDIVCPASVIQITRKWPNITALYHARIASRKHEAKFYIAKGSLNVNNTKGNSQDSLQDTLFYSLTFTKWH